MNNHVSVIIAVLALVLVIILFVLFIWLTPRVTSNSSSNSNCEVMTASATQGAITARSTRIDDNTVSATTTYSSQKIVSENTALSRESAARISNDPALVSTTVSWSSQVQNVKFNELGALSAQKLWEDENTRGQLITALSTNQELADTIASQPAFAALIDQRVDAYLTPEVVEQSLARYFASGATIENLRATNIITENLSATNASTASLETLNVSSAGDVITFRSAIDAQNISVVDVEITGLANFTQSNVNAQTITTNIIAPRRGNLLLEGEIIVTDRLMAAEDADIAATRLIAQDNCRSFTGNYIMAVAPQELAEMSDTIGYGGMTTIRSMSDMNGISTAFDIAAAPRTEGDTPIYSLTRTALAQLPSTTGLTSQLLVKSATTYMDAALIADTCSTSITDDANIEYPDCEA